MAKIQQSSGNYLFIILPKSICSGLSWKKGDAVQVRIAGKNKIELVKEL